MDAQELYEFCLTMDAQERLIFSELVRKLHERPRAVGFVKADFSDDERTLIKSFYELFDYPEKEAHTKIVPATHPRQVQSDESML